MAKENSLILHGIALEDTTVKCDKNGNPVRSMLYLRVIDRTNPSADGEGMEVQYTTVFVYSGFEKVIEKMMPIRKGDLVDVYGTLTTTTIPKKRTCPVCGTLNSSMGNLTYVSPLYVCQREHGLSEEETNKLLEERIEMSNRAYMIGNVCAGLEYSDGHGTRKPALQYQLAINRTIRIHESSEKNNTDYPWVLARGIQAEEGKDALKIGSVVYIKGHLRSRLQTKEIQCNQCGNVFTSKDFPLIRISPHFTEYLFNCNFPEAGNSPRPVTQTEEEDIE